MNHPFESRRSAASVPQTGVSKLELVGQHPLLEQTRALVRKIASTDVTVLVQGESGTGKEVIARMLHAASGRAKHPFVAVNCGAIPADLLESEMFGHERGAFTGAIGSRAGVFQRANQGTIFLDEIGEMSPALQVKLLRVLQEREVQPVGSDTGVKINVRVVAATNKNLEKEITAGRFREDLFYRLNVIPVTLPPLRERRSDVPLLVEHFLAKHSERHRHDPVRITEQAMVHLWEYAWPGNVRELENLVERLVVLSENGVIDEDALPRSLRTFMTRNHIPDLQIEESGVDLHEILEEFERRLISKALHRTGGNKKAAARLLGVNRTTLIEKLRRRGDLFNEPQPAVA